MKIKELLTKEEIKDLDRQEGITGQPNWDTVQYWLNKHYKELEIEQVLKLIELDYIHDIKEILEYIENINY